MCIRKMKSLLISCLFISFFYGSAGVMFRIATSSSESCADVCGKYSTCSEKTHKFSCQHAATMACGSLTSFKRYSYDPQCSFDGCLASCSRGIYAINDASSPLQCNVEPSCVYEDVWQRVCVCEDPTTSAMTAFDVFELVAIAFCSVVSLVIITIYGKPLVQDAYKWYVEKNQYKQLDTQSSHSSISLSPMPADNHSIYRAPKKAVSQPLPKPSPTKPSPAALTPTKPLSTAAKPVTVSPISSSSSQGSAIDNPTRAAPKKTLPRQLRDIYDDI